LKWLKAYSEIISLVSTLHLLKYPLSVIRFDYQSNFGIDIPSFGGLEAYNIDKISQILPDGYLKDIEIIANNDPSTQETLKEISSMPDMSEEDLKEQSIRLDKSLIEHGEGFIKWLEHQNKILKLTNQQEFSESMKVHIEILRNWAVENDFMESKPKRLGWNI